MHAIGLRIERNRNMKRLHIEAMVDYLRDEINDSDHKDLYYHQVEARIREVTLAAISQGMSDGIFAKRDIGGNWKYEVKEKL